MAYRGSANFGAGSRITLAIDGSSAEDLDVFSVVIVARRTADTAINCTLSWGGSGGLTIGHFGVMDSDQMLANSQSAVFDFTGPTIVAANSWVIHGIDKATGTGSVRYHKGIVSSSTWTHQNSTDTGYSQWNTPGAGGFWVIGNNEFLEPWTGDIACVAFFATRLSDANYVSLVSAGDVSEAAILAFNPVHYWVCEGNPVVDAGTASAADETSRAALNAGAVSPVVSTAAATPITAVRELGGFANSTAGTTLTMTVPAGGVAIGQTIIISGACDNTGTNGVATTVTCADNSNNAGTANTYTLQTAQAIADPGAAAAGVQGFFLVCSVTRSLDSGDVITVTLGNTTTSKAMQVEEWSGIKLTSPVVSYTTVDNLTSTTTSISRTPTAAEQLVMVLCAIEGGTVDTFTEDLDATNGSWVTLARRGSGTTTSGITVRPSYKIVTASGAQTWDPTMGTARDHCAAAMLIDFEPTGSDASPSAATIAVVVAVPAPTRTTTANPTPSAVAVVVAVPTPAITASVSRTPSAVAVVAAIPSPTITASGNPAPSVVGVVVVTPAPTITASSNPTPAAVAVVVAIPAPARTATANVPAATVAVVAAIPSPTATASGNPAPAAVGVVVATPAPTVTASGNPTPATVAVVAAVPTPTITIGITANPSAVAVVVAVPAPTVTASGNPTPSTVGVLVAIPAPTVTASTSPSSTTVAVAAAVPTPTVTASGNPTPSSVAVVAALPAPTVTASGNPPAAAVAVVVAIPTPSITAGGNASPAATQVAVVAALPAPTVTASGNAAASTVAVVVAVPAPTVSVSRSATVATVTALVAVPAPTVTASGNPAPATVTVAVALPAPTIVTGADAMVMAATVALFVLIHAPRVNELGLVGVSTGTITAATSSGGITSMSDSGGPTSGTSAGGDTAASSAGGITSATSEGEIV